ncbi:hypothetical protein CDO73_04955 [Saccharibacillus sp. O23]|uniref:hypothetical protein n=1 Tax=Saccharibacillus sp. O23 TaxID=2009338 RepID=UPI000B4DFF9E|nr:hypothetical protein [Saccharibacillus sp. O23]OWR31833.1 hypothetical protein CDO73_04955 [Saccharibacillus sp. O23]
MQNQSSEDLIRIRVLPEEATEVAEWAGLMLSELVGEEVSEDGAPVRLRDPERAAELLELLVLCAEEGADATAALPPALLLSEAASEERPESGAERPRQPQAIVVTDSGFAAEWNPYYGHETPSEKDREEPAAYASEAERAEVLMAVRFGASALIDLARSHGLEVPERPSRPRRPALRSSGV